MVLARLALHALHVVDVVLHVEVVRADLLDDVERLRRAVQVEAGDVVGVDRLDQQAEAASSLACGEQVVDQVARTCLGRRPGDAGQAVELLAAEGGGVLDRPAHAGLELARPAQGGRRCRVRRLPSCRPAGCATPG